MENPWSQKKSKSGLREKNREKRAKSFKMIVYLVGSCHQVHRERKKWLIGQKMVLVETRTGTPAATAEPLMPGRNQVPVSIILHRLPESGGL